MPDELTLVALGTMVVELRPPQVLADTPGGTRMIFEVASGTVEGDRLRAEVVGTANADWLVVGSDGTGTLDVRVLLQTHDGALVFVQYNGRVDTTAAAAPIYTSPRFDTGDERYAWLNRLQAVAKGGLDGSTLTYDIYELR